MIYLVYSHLTAEEVEYEPNKPKNRNEVSVLCLTVPKIDIFLDICRNNEKKRTKLSKA